MIRAAGVFFVTDARLALFMRRADYGTDADQWDFPGGKLEDEETALEAAIRECDEESGKKVKAADLTLHTRSISNPIAAPTAEMPAEVIGDALPEPAASAAAPSSDGVDFTTYICRIEKPFMPELNEEHTGFCWASIDAPPEPLHPGCRVAIGRLDWNELDIARAMVRGELTSPQRYANMMLWSMRITGTGVAYRASLGEFVWRDPKHYMHEEFLARIAGLAAIWEHPPKATMDSKEFGNRVVGSVLLPFLKPEAQEVWAVCRVYDDEMNQALNDEEASTSPTVVFGEMSGNYKMKMESGEDLLIEGQPTLIDHIAILPNKGKGVWDKGGEPTGVDRSGVDEIAFADSIMSQLAVSAALFKLRLASVR